MPSAARYAAQKAAAAAAGTTPYKARIASAMAKGAASRAVAEGHAKRAQQAAQRMAARGGTTRKSKDLTIGGKNVGKHTATSSKAKLRDELRQAAKAGQRVSLRATIRKANGDHRTALLDGRGGQAEAVAEGAELRQSEGKGSAEGGGQATVVGDVQITRFDAAALGGAQGFDPIELMDYLDGYDDWWDGIGDLYDVEVS